MRHFRVSKLTPRPVLFCQVCYSQRSTPTRSHRDGQIFGLDLDVLAVHRRPNGIAQDQDVLVGILTLWEGDMKA